jgi:hypothetical protein
VPKHKKAPKTKPAAQVGAPHPKPKPSGAQQAKPKPTPAKEATPAQPPKEATPAQPAITIKAKPVARRETETAPAEGALSAETLSAWVQDLIPKLLAARDHKSLVTVILSSLMTLLLARDG